jgi:hypothetical protein
VADFDRDLAARISINNGSDLPPSSESLDAIFTRLWSEKLSESLAAADFLYAPDNDRSLAWPDAQERVGLHFWRLLMKVAPRMPNLPEARFQAISQSIYRVVRIVRETPTDDRVEEFYAVALRPIRRLQLGSLTEEVCAGLIDYQRGQWHPYLTRSQLHVIESALARTVAALPPDDMEPFWTNLLSENSITRNAMLLGLRHISAAHAVPPLLHGLEEITDHTTRTAIVDHLEKIAEPSAIPTLARLRRETASTDWTLSRQIGRAIRVIEKQNADVEQRVLLRPIAPPLDQDHTLLRPMTTAHSNDPADLLHPIEQYPPSIQPEDRKKP